MFELVEIVVPSGMVASATKFRSFVQGGVAVAVGGTIEAVGVSGVDVNTCGIDVVVGSASVG
jgi:hypothetical protein